MPILDDLYQAQRERKVELSPFFYSAQWLASELAAGATIAKNIPIQSDSHFVVRYFNLTAYAAGLVVVTATPPVLINWFDTGSGRTIQDSPQPAQNLCGGVAAAAGMGNLPFILPEPWMVRAGGVVQVSLTNLGAAAVVRADVSMVGFKVFRFGGQGPGEV